MLLITLAAACSPTHAPAPATAAPSPLHPAAVCDAALLRQHDTCSEQALDALRALPRDTPKRPMSTYTAHQSCVVFPDRRPAVARCLELADCTEWAQCQTRLSVDDWRMADSPFLCQAVTLRRLGTAKDEVEALAQTHAQGLKGLTVDLARLGVACPTQPPLQAALAECLLGTDAQFAACLVAQPASEE